MLTLNALGKSTNESVEIVRDGLKKENADELRVLISGPDQAQEIQKFLAAQGFVNIYLEDDDGALYIVASKEEQTPNVEETPTPPPQQPEKISAPAPAAKTPAPVQNATTGILISCEKGRQKISFLKKFIASLLKTQTKPNVIALVNSAVQFAAYDTKTCEQLKRLENDGVQILVSESCADKLGMTEAAGVGVIVDMSEILEEIFSCGKVISV